MISSQEISIIIPIAAHETAWKFLLRDLIDASFRGEIILSAQEDPSESDKLYFSESSQARISWIFSPPGRAHQMNNGAKVASGKILWFLHADTRLSHRAVPSLLESIRQNDRALFFFDLKFTSDGPKAIWLNTFGVWIRSHLFRLPFGDQGLALRRELFENLGEFNTLAQYGEDHLLIWRAHQCRVPVISVGTSISTSARKYRVNGWMRTTLKHLYLTFAQALPQLWILLRRGRRLERALGRIRTRYE